MIPHLVTVSLGRPDARWLRLYLPVLPVLLVLSPLVLVAVLAGLVACRATRVDPADALRGAGQLLGALRGTRIEIEQGRTAVLVSIR
jgi:hypothetical protein